MNLVDTVHRIKSGEQVDGVTLDGDILTYDGVTYKVMGDRRVRVTPVDAISATKSGIPLAPSLPTTCSGPDEMLRVLTCPRCSSQWTVSKFHPYIKDGQQCKECTARDRRKRLAERRRKTRMSHGGLEPPGSRS